MHLHKPYLLILLLGLLFFISPSQAAAQSKAKRDLRYIDPNKKLTQYILDQWTTDQNLPSNNVRKIYRSLDGYLWLAGFNGLTNFDGARFSHYNKQNIPKLKSNSIYAIAESADSTLWIGTEGSGVYTYKYGRFEQIGLDDAFISCIFVENKERVWISKRNGGLLLFNPRTNILQALDYKALVNQTIYKIISANKQGLWFTTDGKGLVQLKNEKFKTFDESKGLPSNNVLEVFQDKNGGIWAGTTKGAAKLKNGKFEKIEIFGDHLVYEIIQDPSGSLWFATSRGLYRYNVKNEQYEQFPYTKEAPVTNVTDILLDPEGSLWIATYRNGLFRLKDGKFTNHTYQDGLATASVGSICEIAPRQYLIGCNDGTINLIDEESNISTFEIATELPSVRVFNILKDQNGTLWISTFSGLLRKDQNGQETLIDKTKGLPDNTVRVCYEDSNGYIWVGTRWGGVAKVSPQGEVIEVYNRKKGLNSEFIMSIRGDQQGNILVGTNDGGLNVISPKGEVEAYTTQDGLVSNLIFNTYTDQENVTWIAANGGISRLEKGKITNITSLQGLPNDSPFDFVEDAKGQVWLPTSRGLIEVAKKDLNLFAKNNKYKIHWAFYNKHDGMKSEDCTGAAHSLKASDGRIWVPTNGGILVIDPNNIPRNHLKPTIRINELWVDNQLIDLHQKEINLAPGVKRLVFDYSALSLLASSNVRFRYQMVGFDPEWVEAGSERQAVYTNLPPGKHRFWVIACNNDGVWNNEGISVTFVIEPYFYQTTWFYSLLLFLLFCFIYLIFRWRLYLLKKRERELEQLVDQKTARITAQNKELESQKSRLSEQKQLLEKRNNNITQSIAYAQRIQAAILPPLEEIKASLPDSFVFYKPRDIVSGDFYWYAWAEPKPIYKEEVSFKGSESIFQGFTNSKSIIAAVDCTGHGVPGAFMSMIGNDLLNEIVNIRGVTNANEILNELHLRISGTLKQKDNSNQDGMDMVLCVIDEEAKTLEFAGAKNPLFYIKNGELHEIKGDKMPIGGWFRAHETERLFKSNWVDVTEPTTFYLFTDGYQDQFGEESRKKFARHRIRNLLLEIHEKPMPEQKKIIADRIEDWAGSEPQIDDMLVVGFRLGG